MTLKNQLEKITFEHVKDKNYIFIPEHEDAKKNQPITGINAYLALALNMAFENYLLYRNKTKKEFIGKCLPPNSLLLVLKMHNLVIDNVPEIEAYETRQKEMAMEYKRFEFIENLRNYFVHIIHEPGPLKLKNFFTIAEQSETKNYYTDIANYYKDKFEIARNNKNAYLEECESKINKTLLTTDDQAKLRKDLQKITIVKEQIKNYTFYNEEKGELNYDSILFIASMYMRKSQCNNILEKWYNTKGSRMMKTGEDRIINRDNGYINSLKGIFTFFAVKDSLSLTVQNDNLVQFRNIVGHLSVLPEFQNESLIPFYNYIKNFNKSLYAKLDEIKIEKDLIVNQEQSIAKEIQKIQKYKQKKLFKISLLEENKKNADFPEQYEQVNKKIKDITSQLLPLRKVNVITPILLRFLEETNVFEGFEFACKKQPIDYFPKDPENTLLKLKQAIKDAKATKNNVELENAKEAYKERKRGFIFKPKGETCFNYAVRSNNALLRYTHNRKNEIGFKINVLMGDELLLKLVTMQIFGVTADIKKAREIIEKQISTYYRSLPTTNLEDLKKNKFLKISLPSSINVKLTQEEVDEWLEGKSTLKFNTIETNIKEQIRVDESIRRKLNLIKTDLESLMSQNKNQDKPYKFASKKKIDWIMRYNHISFIYGAIKVGVAKKMDKEVLDAQIRHTVLALDEHNLYYQILRFYKRFKNEELFKGVFKNFFNSKTEYFKALSIHFASCNTLEDLFNNAATELIKLLNSINTIDETNRKALITALQLNKPTTIKNIQEYFQLSAVKNAIIHPDVFSIKPYFETAFEKWKLIPLINGKVRTETIGDESLMRYILSKGETLHTNTDFVFEHLLPKFLLNIEDNQKKATKKVILKEFLNHKTKELALWAIAKHYWYATKINNQIEWTQQTNNSEKFQEFNSFYEVYNRTINFTFPETDITLQISPRKMDDEFLYAEISKRQNYKYLQFYIDEADIKRKSESKMENYNKYNFVTVLAVIKTELKKSFSDICLVMAAEKKWVQDFEEKYMALMAKKYANNENNLTNYFLAYDEKKPSKNTNDFNSILSQINLKNLSFTKEDLVDFRNNAMHYQLQNPKTMTIIRNFLLKIIKTDEKYMNFEWDTIPKQMGRK